MMCLEAEKSNIFQVGGSLYVIFFFVTHILYILQYIMKHIFFTDMDTSCALNTWKTGLPLKLYI